MFCYFGIKVVIFIPLTILKHLAYSHNSTQKIDFSLSGITIVAKNENGKRKRCHPGPSVY